MMRDTLHGAHVEFDAFGDANRVFVAAEEAVATGAYFLIRPFAAETFPLVISAF